METIKATIISEQPEQPEREIEYLTAPVPVRKYKLPFASAVAVQVLLTVICGGLLWWSTARGGALAEATEEILRRFLNG